MILNFITAVAWIWGIMMAIGVAFAVTDDDCKPGIPAVFITWGLPAWAWLIARHWMYA